MVYVGGIDLKLKPRYSNTAKAPTLEDRKTLLETVVSTKLNPATVENKPKKEKSATSKKKKSNQSEQVADLEVKEIDFNSTDVDTDTENNSPQLSEYDDRENLDNFSDLSSDTKEKESNVPKHSERVAQFPRRHNNRLYQQQHLKHKAEFHPNHQSRQDKYKTVLCKYYLSNVCQYGESCKFIHNIEEASSLNKNKLITKKQNRPGDGKQHFSFHNQSNEVPECSLRTVNGDQISSKNNILNEKCNIERNSLSKVQEQSLYLSKRRIMNPSTSKYPSPLQPKSSGFNSAFGAAHAAERSNLTRWLSHEVEEFIEIVNDKLNMNRLFKEEAIFALSNEISKIWCYATLEIYGSTATHLNLPSSDIDCVIFNPQFPDIDPNLALKILSNTISCTWCKSKSLVDSAKIPVLKIYYCNESGFGINFDITCATSLSKLHSGCEARNFIQMHQQAMPGLRPLALILKAHLQCYGLNESYSGGLSSYALVLLVIRFLQNCGMYHSVINNADKKNGQLLYCFFNRDGSMWHADIGTLLLNLLSFYTSFDFYHKGISVRGKGFFKLESPEIEPFQNLIPWIDDPLRQNRNISNAFRMKEVLSKWNDLILSFTQRTELKSFIKLKES